MDFNIKKSRIDRDLVVKINTKCVKKIAETGNSLPKIGKLFRDMKS